MMRKMCLVVSLLLFAFSGAATPEDELAAKLPEIIAKSAAHYKALDAAATPLMKDAKGEAFIPHGWSKWNTGRDEYDMRSITWWTAGHFPGSLWYLYEATGDAFFKDRATVWTELVAPNAKVTDNHDVGFIMYCSYGNARRLLKTDQYDALLQETAGSLSQRYDEKLGVIRSWGAITNRNEFLVIPDNLMNLELLEWAGKHFRKIARSHADITMKHHFRPDGGCRHVLDYDVETGRVKGILRGQGASCETAWSRGQSWAIYGYTMMYRMTGYVRYLDFARKLADFAIDNPNMPDDGVPYWDYGAPNEERDTSAASIMASGLLELSAYVTSVERARYRGFAVKQLLALSSSAYYSEGNEVGHFLLKHGVGHKPAKSEIDTPLNYGDYYFLEALLRFRALKSRERTWASLLAKLPKKAGLPSEEPSERMRLGDWSNADIHAENVLTNAIPVPSDELYEEFWKTGDRTQYQKRLSACERNLFTLALAESRERKGRYLRRIEEYLSFFCDLKSWVYPAHDWADGDGGNFRGTVYAVDLGSSNLASEFACIFRLVGDRLDPSVVERVRRQVERRVFASLRREVSLHACQGEPLFGAAPTFNWWISTGNNWNAVCWDEVVCAALGFLDDPNDRAFFVDSALKSMPVYLDGFTPDGYCSEGMGYWNYGFGHHLQMGVLLRRVSDGKIDIFTTERQKKVAAYARAYTLAPGISPAFADGNGAVKPRLQKMVDELWPDLSRDFQPISEFPDGQVWLLRDPDGLSVAFKGGHNGEFHNHNDIGSYFVVRGGTIVAGDAGGEVYTRFTFSDRRYDSKMLNSYGHPVPVIGGKLQSTGPAFSAKVISKDLSLPRSTVVLDLSDAYEVKSLKRLTRTFVHDRTAKTFSVSDQVEFSEPTTFESAYNMFRAAPNRGRNIPLAWDVRPEVVVKGGAYELDEQEIKNPMRTSPHRVAVRMKKPVLTAEITTTYRR